MCLHFVASVEKVRSGSETRETGDEPEDAFGHRVGIATIRQVSRALDSEIPCHVASPLKRPGYARLIISHKYT